MNFEKVSLNQFIKDVKSCAPGLNDSDYELMYNALNIPKRATKGSAGYDFFAPFSFQLKAGESIKIPTGIRVQLDVDKFLAIYPRSGLGFKYKLQLWNGVAVIDADYYNSDNEGHIFIKLYNDSPEGKTLLVEQGEAFAQGIIQQYFFTEYDDTRGVRNGGFGSTTGK